MSGLSSAMIEVVLALVIVVGALGALIGARRAAKRAAAFQHHHRSVRTFSAGRLR